MTREELDARFDELTDEYYDRFGDSYPLDFFESRTLTEVIADIEHCLQTGTPREETPWDPSSGIVI